MATFEPLIRPFETLTTSPRPGVASIPQVAPNVELVVTGGGQTKSGGFSWSWSVSCYADAKQTEQTGA
jgi:hypothetical protein